MDNKFGKTISFPLRPDKETGGLAVTKNDKEIIEQQIDDIIETQQGERVIMPDYGLPWSIFEPIGSDFMARLVPSVQEQLEKYATHIGNIKVEGGAIENGEFVQNKFTENDTEAICIFYTIRGENELRKYLYSTRQLKEVFGTELDSL